ncbi:L-2-aminoadipate reductase large subunit [Paramyrothecium foliicola]|nr:L-2-aminoadipate reductase large subunit [Paramyrothecium foliicola]
MTVTQVSRIIAATAFHLTAATAQTLAVANITGRPRLTMTSRIAALEVFGYAVPAVNYDEWTSRSRSYVADSYTHQDRERIKEGVNGTKAQGEHALLPLFHFVVNDLPANPAEAELDDTSAPASGRTQAIRRRYWV